MSIVSIITTIKTEVHHHQMFNLFDEDGNGSINVEELLNMMAFFIEIGAILLLETPCPLVGSSVTEKYRI